MATSRPSIPAIQAEPSPDTTSRPRARARPGLTAKPGQRHERQQPGRDDDAVLHAGPGHPRGHDVGDHGPSRDADQQEPAARAGLADVRRRTARPGPRARPRRPGSASRTAARRRVRRWASTPGPRPANRAPSSRPWPPRGGPPGVPAGPAAPRPRTSPRRRPARRAGTGWPAAGRPRRRPRSARTGLTIRIRARPSTYGGARGQDLRQHRRPDALVDRSDQAVREQQHQQPGHRHPRRRP